jgi:hypothetical protein
MFSPSLYAGFGDVANAEADILELAWNSGCFTREICAGAQNGNFFYFS